jgi:hypothetical protein
LAGWVKKNLLCSPLCGTSWRNKKAPFVSKQVRTYFRRQRKSKHYYPNGINGHWSGRGS